VRSILVDALYVLGEGVSLGAVYAVHVDSSIIIEWTCVIERFDLMQRQGGMLTAQFVELYCGVSLGCCRYCRAVCRYRCAIPLSVRVDGICTLWTSCLDAAYRAGLCPGDNRGKVTSGRPPPPPHKNVRSFAIL
jgi:hypothetical protein